jgi:hypothetical protein
MSSKVVSIQANLDPSFEVSKGSLPNNLTWIYEMVRLTFRHDVNPS